jgi:hypothetical protein
MRIVEAPVYANNTGNEVYSTAYRGDGLDSVIQGRDSGWIWVNKPEENATPSIFCFNSTHHPITVHKLEASADQTQLPGATFALYKKNAGTPIKSNLISDENGVFVINDPNTWNPTELQGMTAGTYVLKETDAPAGYTKGTDIEFTLMTGSNTKDLVVSDVTGKLVGKSGDGRNLYIYNKPDVGSITVTKRMAEGTTDSTTAHGKVILLFTVEQFGLNDDIEAAAPKATWAKELTYDWSNIENNKKVFDGLPLGYQYKVTELNPARYETANNTEYTKVVNLTATSQEQTIMFTNEKISEYYLSDTYVKLNEFNYLTPDWEPDDNKLQLYDITFLRGNTQIGVGHSVANGKINLVELGYLSSADMTALIAGEWKIQIGNGPAVTFLPNTPITDNCTIIIPDGTTP